MEDGMHITTRHFPVTLGRQQCCSGCRTGRAQKFSLCMYAETPTSKEPGRARQTWQRSWIPTCAEVTARRFALPGGSDAEVLADHLRAGAAEQFAHQVERVVR